MSISDVHQLAQGIRLQPPQACHSVVHRLRIMAAGNQHHTALAGVGFGHGQSDCARVGQPLASWSTWSLVMPTSLPLSLPKGKWASSSGLRIQDLDTPV